MSTKFTLGTLAILGTRGIPARYGGFETFAEKLAVGLVESGHEVTVFCEATAGSPSLANYKGVRLEQIPVVRLGPLTTIVFDIRCLWRARRGFAVVYMLGYGAAPFLLLPRLFDTRVWVNMDGVEWKRSKWSLAGRMYLRAMEWVSIWTANLVIADAEAIRKHLQDRYGQLEKCVMIPYGADMLDRAATGAVAAQFSVDPGNYYLIVCRLEPENHVREILAGFEKSRTARPLLVVGDDRTKTDYVQRLRECGGNRVRFIGTIYDPPTLAALRAHAFAYFHGHSVGGTNPSLLEAMGAGNIILAHDNPFNREVIGPSGLYFRDDQDVPGLVNKVEQMTSDDRIQWQEGVRDRIRSHYSWPLIVEQYAKLLKAD